MSRAISVSGEDVVRFKTNTPDDLAFIDPSRQYEFILRKPGEALLIVDVWTTVHRYDTAANSFYLLSTGYRSTNIAEYTADAKRVVAQLEKKGSAFVPAYMTVYKRGMVVESDKIYIIPFLAFSGWISLAYAANKGLVPVPLKPKNESLEGSGRELYNYLLELFYKDARKHLHESYMESRRRVPIEAAAGVDYFLNELLKKHLQSSREKSNLPVVPYTPY
jgi:hypothetical protein